MKQVLYGQSPATSIFTAPVCGGVDASGTEAASEFPCPAAGTLSNLRVHLSAAPGGVTSRDYWIRQNGVDSALTVHFGAADVDKSDITHSVAVVAGDRISIHATGTGGPVFANGSWSVEFDSTNTGESIYGGNSGSTGKLNAANPDQAVLHSTGWSFFSDIGHGDVLPTAGSITHRRYLIDVAPGVGNSWTFHLYKNGIKQDGTAGSVDTTCVISGAGVVTGNWTGNLPLVAGDTLWQVVTKSGTPGDVFCSFGTCFTATVDGESIIGGSEKSADDNTVANYTKPSNGFFNWNATESTALLQMMGGVTTMYLSKLYVKVTTAPGAAKSYVYDTRVSSATPAGAPTVTLSGAGVTTGQDTSTNTATISAGLTFDIKSTPTGTPTQPGNMAWSWILTSTTGPAAITGTGSITITVPAIDGSGTVVNPVGGTGSIVISVPGISGSGASVPPAFVGTGSITIGHPDISGSGRFTNPFVLDTQQAVETQEFFDAPVGRTSSQGVEDLEWFDAPIGRVTQMGIDDLELLAGPAGRLSQICVEILIPFDCNLTPPLALGPACVADIDEGVATSAPACTQTIRTT